jgi:hypothetical protein
MYFSRRGHTKEYLSSRIELTLELAQKSSDFAQSGLAQDLEFLKTDVLYGFTKSFDMLFLSGIPLANYTPKSNLGTSIAHVLAKYQSIWLRSGMGDNYSALEIKNNEGTSVAHYLAEYQEEWVFSKAAQDYSILKLTDSLGVSVAHTLARHQPKWLLSAASKDYSILKLTDDDGVSVAHVLAQYQSDWIHSEAVQDHSILGLLDNQGLSVAKNLANNYKKITAYALDTEFLNASDKKILTFEEDGKLLAEYISDTHDSYKVDFVTMAMRLISQGAAYKHSQAISASAAHDLRKQAKILIADSLSPDVALKYALAFYSTCHYSAFKAKSSKRSDALDAWVHSLMESEHEIREILSVNPYLCEVSLPADILCEPGDDLLTHLKSERALRDLKINSSLDSNASSESADSLAAKNGLY